MLAKMRLSPFLPNLNINSTKIFAGILFLALAAFEAFNYSTTDFALRDLLGEIRFVGIPWATILAFAFCGIDFAGIARLFTPQEAHETKEAWYLFGAWLLAATMNALLTWWGVSMAIASHPVQSAAVMDATLLTKVVPAFVAAMVWVIRILIIGTLSVAGSRLWNNPSHTRRPAAPQAANPVRRPATENLPLAASARPAATAHTVTARPGVTRPMVSSEPTYHSFSAPAENNSQVPRQM